MSLLEGQQLEVEVAMAEIPLLLIGQGIETEEVELMGMIMDKVAQEVVQEVDEEMAMAMEMEMETVKKKTIRVKLLVIEDLLDHKAFKVFKAQQVYKVFKVHKEPLDPKDYRVYLALMVGKGIQGNHGPPGE